MDTSKATLDTTDYLKLESRLGKRESRKVGNNTYLQSRGDGSIAVLYHHTDILRVYLDGDIRVYPDGDIRVNTGGWHTVTTAQRLNQWLPMPWGQTSRKGEWFLTHSVRNPDYEAGGAVLSLMMLYGYSPWGRGYYATSLVGDRTYRSVPLHDGMRTSRFDEEYAEHVEACASRHAAHMAGASARRKAAALKGAATRKSNVMLKAAQELWADVIDELPESPYRDRRVWEVNHRIERGLLEKRASQMAEGMQEPAFKSLHHYAMWHADERNRMVNAARIAQRMFGEMWAEEIECELDAAFEAEQDAIAERAVARAQFTTAAFTATI